jgi:hypothetical protein
MPITFCELFRSTVGIRVRPVLYEKNPKGQSHIPGEVKSTPTDFLYQD